MAFGLLTQCCLAAAKDRVDEVADLILRSPEFIDVTLSPDGSHLGLTCFRNDQRTIGTYDLERKRGRYLTLELGFEIHDYTWLNDDWLVYSLSRWNVFHEGTFLIHERVKNQKQIDDPRARRLFGIAFGLPSIKGDVLLVNYATRPFSELYRFRYPDNLWEISDRHEFVLDLAFDQSGSFRLKEVATDIPDQSEVFHRPNDDSDWQRIEIPNLEGLYGFNYSGQVVFVTHKLHQRTVLQGFDPVAQEFVGGVILDPDYAISPNFIRSAETGGVLGFSYYSDRPVVRYLDQGLEQIASQLERTLPDQVHRYIGRRGKSSFLFSSHSDRQPQIIHELNLETRELKRVIETYPGIKAEDMAPKVPFTFPSRDGTTLRGYYTLPQGADPENLEPSPMIVIVHGGPRARDYWGYDAEVQFFAQLGYTVLQVNYRGSENMYEELEPLSFLEACRYGVDDVIDGTRWMVAQGFADPDRLAVYGWSFGGYSAVACVAAEPELFQCAYAAAGVYDWIGLWDEREKYFSQVIQWQEEYIGDLRVNEDEYRALSPIYSADRIQVPVYLLHGGADGVVGIEQSRAMYRALKKAGREVELETPGWLRHGLKYGSQRIRFTKDVYKFCEASFRRQSEG